MKNPRKTRGEYRPFYEALFTGSDYRALPKDAKLALCTLKGLSGVMGLKVWPALAESLAELCSMSVREARAAVAALLAAGWIEYADGVVWVVRGLEFEPQMSPNNPDHHKRMRELAAGLPSCGIVARFRERYAAYLGETAAPASAPSSHPASVPPSVPPSLAPSPTPTITITPPLPFPLPDPVPIPITSNDAGQRLRDAARLLTIAANAGISVKYGEQPSPIHHGHGGGMTAAELLAAAGVDLDFAQSTVFTLASTCTNAKPPHSVHFFTQAVIARWESEQAKAAAADYTPKAAAQVDQMRVFAIGYAREGRKDWQDYCDERDIPWREVAA